MRAIALEAEGDDGVDWLRLRPDNGAMPKRRPAPARPGHPAFHDPLAGLPTGQHSPFTPQGEAEQADKFMAGLRRQRGWRGGMARLFAAAALLAIIAVIAVVAIHSFTR